MSPLDSQSADSYETPSPFHQETITVPRLSSRHFCRVNGVIPLDGDVLASRFSDLDTKVVMRTIQKFYHDVLVPKFVDRIQQKALILLQRATDFHGSIPSHVELAFLNNLQIVTDDLICHPVLTGMKYSETTFQATLSNHHSFSECHSQASVVLISMLLTILSAYDRALDNQLELQKEVLILDQRILSKIQANSQLSPLDWAKRFTSPSPGCRSTEQEDVIELKSQLIRLQSQLQRASKMALECHALVKLALHAHAKKDIFSACEHLKSRMGESLMAELVADELWRNILSGRFIFPIEIHLQEELLDVPVMPREAPSAEVLVNRRSTRHALRYILGGIALIAAGFATHDFVASPSASADAAPEVEFEYSGLRYSSTFKKDAYHDLPLYVKEKLPEFRNHYLHLTGKEVQGEPLFQEVVVEKDNFPRLMKALEKKDDLWKEFNVIYGSIGILFMNGTPVEIRIGKENILEPEYLSAVSYDEVRSKKVK